MNLLSVRREVGEFKKRYKWMALTVAIVFGGLFARMIQLQLVDHEHFASVARENISRTRTLPATRGIITDTAGRVLADNRPAYNVYLTPQYLAETDVAEIGELMGLDEEDLARLQARIDRVDSERRAHQIRVFSDIGRDQLAALETHQQDLCARVGSRTRPRRLPCITTLTEPVRTYPFGRLAAHTIGYLNEMTAEEYARLQSDGYRLGDRTGRTGIERAWESYLRGRRGFRRVFVDAGGREMSPEGDVDERPRIRAAVPGRNLVLTLDMDLMRIAERAFGGYPSGAAVVVDVNTGAIRALYSKPSYNLASFAAGLTVDEYAELRDHPFRPLIDRTVYESYFPGSTFKVVGALAGLQSGVIDPEARVECAGSYTLGRTRFGCTASHGEVNLRQALVQSCNVYFYRLAENLGIDRLAQTAGDFGLGRRTGVGINTEARGFIPDRAWYESTGRSFRIGYTLNNTIGQGDTKVTLVQLGMAYAAMANGGTLHVPQLVERVLGPDGAVIEEFEPRVRRQLDFAPEHLELLGDGLFGAVHEAGGTANDALTEMDGMSVDVSGKTGTAQVSRRIRPGQDPRQAAYLRRAHAWFAGFAPSENPELAIVILVEHGGPGGRYAAPIALRIFEEYLGGRGESSTASLGAASQVYARGAP